MTQETIIKSKTRVQLHGEVFTPKRIVKKMLDSPGIKEETQKLDSTFLEPAAGEGAFLLEILRRKLQLVKENYNQTLAQYENYSLYALSTIYGIELLDDNLTSCILNIYDLYYRKYLQVLSDYNKRPKEAVLSSAKLIIKTNIIQGDFLTRLNDNGKELVFSEWKALGKLGKNKTITVSRTEYSLDQIARKEEKKSGSYIGWTNGVNPLQASQLSFLGQDPVEDQKHYKYKDCKITDIYLEEIEGE